MHLDLCCAESACHRSNKTVKKKDLNTHIPVLVNTIRPSELVDVLIQRTGFVFYRTLYLSYIKILVVRLSMCDGCGRDCNEFAGRVQNHHVRFSFHRKKFS